MKAILWRKPVPTVPHDPVFVDHQDRATFPTIDQDAPAFSPKPGMTSQSLDTCCRTRTSGATEDWNRESVR